MPDFHQNSDNSFRSVYVSSDLQDFILELPGEKESWFLCSSRRLQTELVKKNLEAVFYQDAVEQILSAIYETVPEANIREISFSSPVGAITLSPNGFEHNLKPGFYDFCSQQTELIENAPKSKSVTQEIDIFQ